MATPLTYPGISHEEVFACLALSPGNRVVVVTPNHRLAQALQREFGDFQARQGRVLWDAADILPWSGFLARAWHEALYSDDARPAMPLSVAQARVLWENLLRNSAAGDSLLVVSEAARLAHEAWQLMNAWRLATPLRGDAWNEDARAFLQWAPRYERTLQRNGQIDPAQLADYLPQLLDAGAIPVPQSLIAYGFDGCTPQQSDCLAALQDRGCRVLQAGPPRRAGRVLRMTCVDAEHEIRRAAAWARTRLEAGCARIGIVVPDLAAQRAGIVRIFSATMAPDYALPGVARSVLPFNLSLGEPLTAYPLVHTALQCLGLAGHEIEFESVSRLLRSPFVAGGETERAQRATLDALLRRRAEPVLTLERLLALVAASEGACPELTRRLAALHTLRRQRLDGQQAPSSWAKAMSDALSALGYPGERGLDSVEYQTLKKWHEVVASLATLDRVIGRMTYAEALSRLRRMAADTLFQPETPEVPIQILGVLEAEGQSFDALWVMRLGDAEWPPAPRPNPFLPLAVQRGAGLPHASAAGTLALARRITEQWRFAADEVVFSHPAREGDRELRPSPLIAAVAVADAAIAQYPEFRDAIHAAGADEPLSQDMAAPALAGGAVPGGGTALIKDQAACPFRAFARHRLHAAAPETPHTGLDAAERGTLVHRVLARVWAQLGSSDALAAISHDDLERLLNEAADAAMARIRRERPTTLRGRFAAIEKQRLMALAREWLQADRQRSGFRVIAVEDRRSMAIGGLSLNARLDRVDETADGRRMVMDYKTGHSSAGAMLGGRPEEPQLPLYLVTAEPGAVAAAFAQVKTGAMRFSGLARDGDLLPGIKALADSVHRDRYASWDDVVAAWRTDLERIAASFAAGAAAVDPLRYPQTCRYCDLQPFCRIHQRLVSALADDDEAP